VKKIVFLGNCQARRLYVLYNEKFAPLTGDTTELVANFEALTPRVAEILADADVIVAQVTDAEQKVTVDKVQTKAQVIEYPYVTGNFLWPHSGREHLLNQPLPHLHDGPFGVQFGNPWLNARIKAGARPEDIVAEYEALDLSKAINLDRTYELSLQRARERDRKSGFRLADIIEKTLSDIPLFMTPANFELPLFRPFAAGVYERLGIPAATVQAMLDTLWRTPFPIADHPIHPSIAQHFGLKFIGPDTLYRTLTGESLTYREWLTDYVHYRWNDALLEGVYKSGRFRRFDADAQAVLDQLDAGLAQSAGSAQGENSKAYLLQLKGDLPRALAAIRRASELDPDNPQIIGSLAFYLADQGGLEEAERLLHDATSRWPHYAEGWNRLGSVLLRRRKPDDAVGALGNALEIDPWNVGLRRHFAAVLLHVGQPERARAVLNAGLALMPDQAELVGELSRLFAQTGDLDNALVAARRAAALQPQAPDRHLQLVDILERRDDVLGVLGALREAVAAVPKDAGLSNRLADLLAQLGRHDEARLESHRISLLEGAHASLCHPLAKELVEKGSFRQAEEKIAEAISADPFDERLHAGLADVLARQGRLVEAGASADRALQLKPDDAELRTSLAPLLTSLGRRDMNPIPQAAE